MTFRGPIFLFVAFVALTLHSPSVAAAAVATNYDELLAKLNRLEGVFHQEMTEAKGRIAHLEQENQQLTREFSAAKKRIGSLEGEVERLSGLLLRPLATSNRRHPVRGAAAAYDNGQRMIAGDDAESRAIVTPPPTSCASLAQLGNRVTGFYLVLDEESNNRIQTVYCDFALAFNNPDYEKTIGYLDVKTSPSVSFYVQRSSSYGSPAVIPYEVTRLNVGGHMNAETGVFTAPVNGRYYFSFTAASGSPPGFYSRVYLRVKGANIANSFAPSTNYNLPLVATLQLIKGDTVDVYLDLGSIVDGVNHQTQFSGFLLEEDIVL